MSDMPASSTASTAGALIRAERERRGLRIETLATTLKVSPRKLEALEADRHDELPGPAFTRALALSVCRMMGVEAAPVLALMPRSGDSPEGLEHVTTGLRTPFEGRSGQGFAAALAPRWRGPSTPLMAAAGLAVLVVGLLWWSWSESPPAPVAAEGVASAPVIASSAGVPASAPAAAGSAASASLGLAAAPAASLAAPATGGASTPAGVAQSSAAPVAMPPPAPMVSAPASAIKVTAATWVELRDGSGRVLWARTLAAGETAALAGPAPLRLVVGNASAASVVFAGRPIDLTPWTRDNVARLDLQ
jgi:cytoskeleton protein RodZ